MNPTRFGWVIAGICLGGFTALIVVVIDLKRAIARVQAPPIASERPAGEPQDAALAQRVVRLEEEVRRLEAARKSGQAGALDPEVVREAVKAAMAEEEDRRHQAAVRASLERAQGSLKGYLDQAAKKISLDSGQQSAVLAIMTKQLEDLLGARETAEPGKLRDAMDLINDAAFERILGVLREEQREPFIRASRIWFGGTLVPERLKKVPAAASEAERR